MPSVQDVAGSQTAYPLASGVQINSPSNRTYLSSTLTLDVGVTALVASNIQISMNYSLDGIYNGSIPLNVHTRENSFQASITGEVDLPSLSYGSHSITVFVQHRINNEISHLDNRTVYFAVSDTIPPDELIAPVISNLSIENKTYNTTKIQFSFDIDKTASLISYCLDEQTNRTIAFLYDLNKWGNHVNATVTGLSDGSHNLVVYATNPAGKTGTSKTVYFTVKTNSNNAIPEFPVWTPILTSLFVIAAVGTYYKKKINLRRI